MAYVCGHVGCVPSELVIPGCECLGTWGTRSTPPTFYPLLPGGISCVDGEQVQGKAEGSGDFFQEGGTSGGE